MEILHAAIRFVMFGRSGQGIANDSRLRRNPKLERLTVLNKLEGLRQICKANDERMRTDLKPFVANISVCARNIEGVALALEAMTDNIREWNGSNAHAIDVRKQLKEGAMRAREAGFIFTAVLAMAHQPKTRKAKK